MSWWRIGGRAEERAEDVGRASGTPPARTASTEARAPRVVGKRESLLAPSFLSRLDRLQIVSRRFAEARRRGRRRARRAGSGVEAIDARAYVPGDDARRIDWKAYARFERLVVRVVAEESPLRLALVLDTSASMGFGVPTKLRQASRLAAGFAAIGLGGEDRVTSVATAERAEVLTRASGGRRGLLELCAALDPLEASSGTALARSAEVASASLGGRGLCVIFSDLLDPDGALAGARACRLRGHEVLVVEVLTPFELDPPDLAGFELEDAETGEVVELPAEGALAAYRACLSTHRAEVDAEAEALGVGVLRLSTDESFDDVLLRALERGVVGGGHVRGGGLGRVA
ncbi:MAG: DUF58 domain-containing protein [Myxococcales bacterium]|nr:DUF58 domain-containing protein [Myxococcales bacterium]